MKSSPHRIIDEKYTDSPRTIRNKLTRKTLDSIDQSISASAQLLLSANMRNNSGIEEPNIARRTEKLLPALPKVHISSPETAHRDMKDMEILKSLTPMYYLQLQKQNDGKLTASEEKNLRRRMRRSLTDLPLALQSNSKLSSSKSFHKNASSLSIEVDTPSPQKIASSSEEEKKPTLPVADRAEDMSSKDILKLLRSAEEECDVTNDVTTVASGSLQSHGGIDTRESSSSSLMRIDSLPQIESASRDDLLESIKKTEPYLEVAGPVSPKSYSLPPV